MSDRITDANLDEALRYFCKCHGLNYVNGQGANAHKLGTVGFRIERRSADYSKHTVRVDRCRLTKGAKLPYWLCAGGWFGDTYTTPKVLHKCLWFAINAKHEEKELVGRIIDN